MENDRCFERLMSLLESQQQMQTMQQLEVDPEIDTFVSGIAFSLQKTKLGQECKKLFADIRALIYDTLYPCCITAPYPRGGGLSGAEPNINAFRPPWLAVAPSTPTVHGDSTGFSNWSVPTYQMHGSGEATHTIPYQEL